MRTSSMLSPDSPVVMSGYTVPTETSTSYSPFSTDGVDSGATSSAITGFAAFDMGIPEEPASISN